MEKIKMIIKDLKEARIKQFYDLILLESDGARALNISIGDSEAENIAIYMDKIPSPRPLTYDIFVSILQSFDLKLKEVLINKFFDGNFYALVTIGNDNKDIKIDMRPSDAINMALRFDCPIFTTEEIMDIAGFDYCKFFNEVFVQHKEATVDNIDNLSVFGMNMLQDLLKDAIEKEDYITASILRDKIKNMGEIGETE